MKDIHVDSYRHLVFHTTDQLKILTATKTWYMDGTFKIVRQPFVQMFSIHAFLSCGDGTKQVLLVFCLMSRKHAVDYRAVLDSVVECMPRRPAVQTVVADFEKGIWKGVQRAIPGVTIRGCNFHFTQAVWRRIQKYGLAFAYFKRDGVFKFCKKLMSLAYLPEPHIRPAFEKLTADIKDPSLLKLVNYVAKTWLHSKVSSWTVFGQPTRTNNDVEGWHRRLNKKNYDQAPPMYTLIQRLPLQRKLVSEGKLSRLQRKRARTTQAQIFALWDQYNAKEISTNRLLQLCSAINGPSQE